MSNSLLDKYLQKQPLIIFDIGAKNGIFELQRLASHSEAYGFEPNPVEFDKLKSKKHQVYCKEEYLNLALAEFEGESEMNISRNSSFSSLLNANWINYQKHFGFMQKVEEWKKIIETVEKIKVQVTTLDNICENLNVKNIDYLKLDTQGTELSILKGAKNLLKNHSIGIIKCEVAFIPVYQNQPAFSEIDIFLKENNFIFIDCLFYKDVIYEKPKLKRNLSPIPSVYEPTRYSAGGDAFWIPDFKKIIREDKSMFALKCGIMLAELGYFGMAFDILNNYAEISKEDIKLIFEYFFHKSFKTKLKEQLLAWIPPVLLSKIKSIVKTG